MKESQIIEIFVKAAEVDRKLPDKARPARLKAMNMGYLHSFADMNHWDAAEKHAANWAWLDPKNLRATTNDVGLWQAAMEMIKLAPNYNQRRALWAFARAEAGGQSFSKWCRAEGGGRKEGQSKSKGISRQLGMWRKDRAIECIMLAFQGKALLHNGNDEEEALRFAPEIEDKGDNIRVLRLDGAKPSCKFDEDLMDLSWYEAQKERRRQRDKRKAA